MKYKAVMFDFDGTVTNPGQFHPPQEMADLLVSLSKKVPIAFCTGRQLESFVRRMDVLLEEMKPEERHPFLENLYLMAENGAIGYHFRKEVDEYVEFYRAEWPAAFADRLDLMKELDEVVSEFGEIYHEAHRVVIVMRTKSHESGDHKKIYGQSAEIYETVLKHFTAKYPDFEKYVHVGNSGLGVVIGPADGDKDHGIKEFGEYLRREEGLKLDDQYRDILLIGDSPQVGGNDHYFLNGTFGTAYTVGQYDEKAKWPRPVLDQSGKRLKNVKGTIHLVSETF